MPFNPEPFRCEVRTQREAVSIHPAGELDLATVPVVIDHLSELQAAGFKHLTPRAMRPA